MSLSRRAWPNFLAYPALIEVAGTSGSGFSIGDNEYSYLVSAAHVLFKEKLETHDQPIRVTLLDYNTHKPVHYELDSGQLFEGNCLAKHSDRSVDVAVCRFGVLKAEGEDPSRVKEFPVRGVKEINHDDDTMIQGISLDAVARIANVRLCESVLLLSHPTSLTHGDPALSRGYPLMRSGMVAGKPPSDRIVIDCPTYPGNSGGLVLRTSDQAAIGVAVRNVSFTEKLYSSVDKSEVSIRRQNSGFTVVEPMDRVLDIIEEMRRSDTGPPALV
jgi:hypothetical protein